MEKALLLHDMQYLLKEYFFGKYFFLRHRVVLNGNVLRFRFSFPSNRLFLNTGYQQRHLVVEQFHETAFHAKGHFFAVFF
ncbi:MAG: hypothetical protein IPH12_04970 [Saprospirales bacterium]|nr:hypothetical protein [Saprospirales bacterium]